MLAQLSFWRGALPLQVCQLPGTKNTSLKRALLCMQLSLSWAGRKQTPGVFCALQEGHNQLSGTIIKRIGTELRTQPLLSSSSL